jgi:hypothetical protein
VLRTPLPCNCIRRRVQPCQRYNLDQQLHTCRVRRPPSRSCQQAGHHKRDAGTFPSFTAQVNLCRLCVKPLHAEIVRPYHAPMLYLSGAMRFLYGYTPVGGPYVEVYEFYIRYGFTYTIVLEVPQVDLLALGALQQPFLPLLFLECALLAPRDNLPCNDGDGDGALEHF